MPDEHRQAIAEMFLLTAKPVMYVANVDEKGLGGNAFVDKVRAHAKTDGAEVVVVCAAIEAEIAQLDDADKQAFLDDLKLTEPGLNRVILRGLPAAGPADLLHLSAPRRPAPGRSPSAPPRPRPPA